jgi:predicted nucleic acid-binding protein
MILVDTSVIVAWLDRNHPHHRACLAALELWAQQDRLAVSSVTLAELAAGGRTRDAVDEDLRDFEVLPLDADTAWRAGVAYRQYRRKETDDPVLPDFFIRAQAAMGDLRHLTNDRRRTRSFSDVDFEFV